MSTIATILGSFLEELQRCADSDDVKVTKKDCSILLKAVEAHSEVDVESEDFEQLAKSFPKKFSINPDKIRMILEIIPQYTTVTEMSVIADTLSEMARDRFETLVKKSL